jgi:hypothetical protein
LRKNACLDSQNSRKKWKGQEGHAMRAPNIVHKVPHSSDCKERRNVAELPMV